MLIAYSSVSRCLLADFVSRILRRFSRFKLTRIRLGFPSSMRVGATKTPKTLCYLRAPGSSLIAVVELRGERTVHFSHFSALQFLTSDLIAKPKDFSNFHILLEPAHTFLARVCLSLLLHLDEDEPNETGGIHDSPLHSYATKHWVDHARFGNVSSSSIILEGMDRLFDRDRPHFAAWIRAYKLKCIM